VGAVESAAVDDGPIRDRPDSNRSLSSVFNKSKTRTGVSRGLRAA
jgi:hypothetical protein